MVRSLYSGVAGLTTHQTRMDVIGNNIANVNTYGYKANRTTFSDIYYQAKKSGSAGSATFAGNNQSAVGYGVEISSIDKDMSSSSFQSTNRTLDLAVSGDGFFMCGTVDELGNVNGVTYTRYGNFGVDSEGNLVDTMNNFVLGTKNDGTYSSVEMNTKVPADKPLDLDTINVNELIWDAFIKDTQVDYEDVPETVLHPVAGEETSYVTSMTDPDDATNLILRDAQNGEPSGVVTDETDGGGEGDTAARITAGHILHNVNGKYVNENGIVYDTKTGYYLDNDGNSYLFNKSVDPDTGEDIYKYTRVTFDADGNPSGTGTEFTYNKVTGYYEGDDGTGNTVYANMMDGSLKYSDLDAFTVSTTGVLVATFGGQIKSLARVELATFDNIEGLDQIGETSFGESSASGPANVKVPGSNGTGTVQSSKLEMSNVNLASEFSDMIVTQRGFQANARIITTSDSMLEELVNLKR